MSLPQDKHMHVFMFWMFHMIVVCVIFHFLAPLLNALNLKTFSLKKKKNPWLCFWHAIGRCLLET